jgi:hypothetical protein
LFTNDLLGYCPKGFRIILFDSIISLRYFILILHFILLYELTYILNLFIFNGVGFLNLLYTNLYFVRNDVNNPDKTHGSFLIKLLLNLLSVDGNVCTNLCCLLCKTSRTPGSINISLLLSKLNEDEYGECSVMNKQYLRIVYENK